jgi:hypothetical protein
MVTSQVSQITCVEIRVVEMLTLVRGLCCIGYINTIGVWRRAQLIRLHLKTETESSPKRRVLNKRQDDG